MTKSPRAVAQEALRLAQATLPPYSAVRSRKDFTQHQHFAILALKTFLKTDYRGVVAFLKDFAELRDDLALKKVPHHSTLNYAEARLLKGGVYLDLLEGTVTSALESKLISEKPTVAIDATGLDSRHASRYFVARSKGQHTARSWPKLTAAFDTHSHFIAGATVTVGPTNDSPQFTPVLLLASLLILWDRVLADAAFDSEEHHRFAREDLNARSSVIPINNRGHEGVPGGKYRAQMARHFRPREPGNRHRRVYGQRSQAESAFSRHKRRLGSAVAARSEDSRKRECYLRVLTHNLMLLAAVA